jgi:hypothetical protein
MRSSALDAPAMHDPAPQIRELIRRAYIDAFNSALSWKPPPPEAERAAEQWLRRNLDALAAALPAPPAPAEALPATPGQLTYQPAQAARILGISRSYLWKKIKAGELPTFQFLGMTMIRAEDLAAARDAAWSKRPAAASQACGPWPVPGRSRNTPPTPP